MSLLKTALRWNAVSCIGFGVLFSVVPGAVATFLGLTRPAPSLVILILGIGLLLAAGALKLGSVTLTTANGIPNALGPVFENAHTTANYRAARFHSREFGRAGLLETARRLERDAVFSDGVDRRFIGFSHRRFSPVIVGALRGADSRSNGGIAATPDIPLCPPGNRA